MMTYGGVGSLSMIVDSPRDTTADSTDQGKCLGA
jgi:hypothetical protein